MTTVADGPLAGVRVLDLGRIIAAPFASQVLGDLGAAVIKVERPGHGDESRIYSTDHRRELSSLFLGLNRNKRSVTLDLASEPGRSAIKVLIEQADVLLHNYRPGVAERLGIGYDTVKEWNPRLIYCALSGFGPTGPMAEMAGNDLIAQAYSGLLSFMGEPDRPPVRCPVPIADYTAGLYAVIGVLAALRERTNTQQGQLVETSLLEGMLSLEGVHIAEYFATGTVPQALGSRNALGQPNQVFATADGQIVIAVVNDPMWVRCAQALGAPELATDARFATAGDRYRHLDEVAQEVEDRTRRLATTDCLEALTAAGVACAPVLRIDEIAHDEQVRHLGVIMPIDEAGRDWVVGSPLRMGGVRPGRAHPPPRLGEHTEEVLGGAGWSSDYEGHRASETAPEANE